MTLEELKEILPLFQQKECFGIIETRRMYFKLCFLYKSLNHLTHVPNEKH